MLLVLTFLLLSSLTAKITRLNQAIPEQRKAAAVLPDGFVSYFMQAETFQEIAQYYGIFTTTTTIGFEVL